MLAETLGRAHLQEVVISTERAGDASRVGREVTRLLRERHRLTRAAPPAESDAPHAFRRSGRLPDDFVVRTQATSALTEGLYTTAAAFVLASMPRLDEMTSEEMVGTLNRATSTMTLLLGALAGVSLVVGGVGIMNVMLLAVTEAHPRDRAAARGGRPPPGCPLAVLGGGDGARGPRRAPGHRRGGRRRLPGWSGRSAGGR